MAADVSSLVRIMKGYKEDQQGVNENGKSTALITRDLLGGSCTLDSKELDLDLQVPSGWEKRLDLKSGKVYLQRCNSPNSSSSSDHKPHSNGTVANFQDLNFPPSLKQPLNLFEDPSLDLNLVPSPSTYQSVCTLDKVKSALERAEKETIKKRSISMSNSSSPPSNSSSSIKMDYDSSPSFAAGCPRCLLYVLIPKNDPKCPRCHIIVPSPIAMKKPRFDLNITI
ncbi:uncharacterized protein LOC130751602 [Actinidia eriantha]|uniref:uncharacterized protein LOC130751602 n=1 Tax=Actinidia eriantha TaxID=165200 RepID=UPI00258997B9|nr:uncharacterized protein LOC130751602 [Actinidia eriantha]